VNKGKQQSLQRYNKPVTLTGLRDTNNPYSFKDWYSAHKFITAGQEYILYNNYLVDWFKNKGIQSDSTAVLIQLNYLALLKQLQLFFSKEEAENWYNNVDITNEKELLLAIPYFAKKLKEISLYYLQLRKTIKDSRLNYNQAGTDFGITQQIQNYILNNYTQKPNSLISLPSYIWNNVPALSSINDTINIQIEELYDSHNYFDQSFTVAVSTYNDLNNINLQKFLTTKNLALTSTSWLYSLGEYSLSTDPLLQVSILSADPAFQAIIQNNILTLNNQLAETYIGQNKYTASQSSDARLSQDFYSIELQQGNNTLYWPDALYPDKAQTYPHYQPVLLTDMGLETLATGGPSIELADTIFVKTAPASKGDPDNVQGAWLYNELYKYTNPTMQAVLPSYNKTTFIYPYPGYGLSAEGLNWTGPDTVTTSQFNYLDNDTKNSILNAYWSANISLTSTTNNLNINDTSLVSNGAYSSTILNNADQIKIRQVPPRYSTQQQYADTSEGAWLYQFKQTDISIARGKDNVIIWPFEKIDPTVDLPTYYPTNLTNTCSSVSVRSLNVPFAIASNMLSSADVIYKINNYKNTKDLATECCWLSCNNVGVSLTNDIDINTINQSTFQVVLSSGAYTRFFWGGTDTDINNVFTSFNHQPDCKYVTTPNTTYLDSNLCTCGQVLFTPFGHPGLNYTDYSSLADFIIEDNFLPGSIDINTTTNTDIYWYNTANAVGWGNGNWVNINSSTCTLKQNTPYIYYRANVKYQDTLTSSLPELVVRYDIPALSSTPTPVWIQATKDKNNNWVSNGQVSQMVINPGDILLYSRVDSTQYSLSSLVSIPQDISLNKGSIWSNYDYMSVGNNSAGIPKTITLAYPTITPGYNVSGDPQYPGTDYTQISAIIEWTLSDGSLTQSFKGVPSLNFTPDPNLTTTTLYSATVTYKTTKIAGASTITFTNIPLITALPFTVQTPSVTSLNVTAPGFVLNTPLYGWNYSTAALSNNFDNANSNIGAIPYWGKIYNQKNQNTEYKGIESWGTPLRLLDDYNILTQPEISPIQLKSGIYVEYLNRNSNDLNWSQPISLATYVNSNTWCTLNVNTTSVSNLSAQLNNINTEFVITPTTTPSNITLQNFVNNQPTQVFYNAINSFTWNITATPFSASTIYNNVTANLAIKALAPWANISNQVYPTVAAFQSLDGLYSSNDSGGYFIPSNLGVSVYTNKDYTATLVVSSAALSTYFEDVSKTVGIRGFSKIDQPTPYVITLENNSWLKETTLSSPIAGNIKKDVFKKYLKFLPYQSTYETTPRNNLGIILPNSKQTPWGGYQDQEWIDVANKPESFTGTYNVSAWTGAQTLKQNNLQLDNWVTDIFGNQYGLYKNIKDVSPIYRKDVPGQIWTRNNLQFVSPATTSLSSIFSIYANTSIVKDLTGGNVSKIDTFFDILYIETSGCAIFDKVNYDYNTGVISSTPDFSTGLSLAIPVTASLVREFSNIDLTNYTYATMGDTWFFPIKNIVIMSVCGLFNNILTPELYQYDIKTYNISKIFPLTQTDVSTFNSLSSLNLISIDTPTLSYNNLTSQYLLTIFGKDNNNNDRLIETVIDDLDTPVIDAITVYTTDNVVTIVDPPAITQPLTVTLSANTPFNYNFIPNVPNSKFEAYSTPSWITFTKIARAYNTFNGRFYGITPSLTGTYYSPFYIANNIGSTYYTLTINVTSS
jgi:hypothetical protein